MSKLVKQNKFNSNLIEFFFKAKRLHWVKFILLINKNILTSILFKLIVKFCFLFIIKKKE